MVQASSVSPIMTPVALWERVPVQLPAGRRVELLAHLRGAFDLAEGEPVGHAARVTHLALAFARRLRLPAASRRRITYAGLLHDAGVAVRDSLLSVGVLAWIAA